ncbi:MAG: metallophosphoesterase [Clostridia bacterium]|nr:metallophosphoesterase [Clostridia bacterium]
MKRILSLVLVLVMVFGAFAVNASAADDGVLRFDENGEFKIMHICDCQDDYPADPEMLTFLDAVVKEYKPDLVVLGGDNTVGPENMKQEDKDAAIKELVSVFVENETYFTLVFGNHDHQQGFTDDELFVMYQKHGGKYCLAYDADPSLTGTATHALPVLGSESGKTELMLYMFDSNQYVSVNRFEDEYDSVNPDQIEWYKNVSKAAEAENGKVVPALVFQHIIVGEVYDALFHEAPFDMGELSRTFNGKTYSFLPRTENIESGFLFEFPCPGYYNHGQFDAMVERGDVMGIFSGHDHTNDFVTELDGIKIVNTAGATHGGYSTDFNRGVRMITVNENNPGTFETEMVTTRQFAIDNSDYAEAVGISKFGAAIVIAFGDFLEAMGKFTGIFSRLF